MRKTVLILSVFFLSLLNLYSQNTDYIDILNQINKDSLYSYIAELSGERQVMIDGELITLQRSYRDGNESATKYLYKKLEEFGYHPEILECEYKTTNVKNVTCEKQGIMYPDEIIIICAHYDSESTGAFAPGADDNATGCAVVMELARILKKYNHNKTIIFAFWDAEEWGMIGSRCFANNAVEDKINIKAIINLDMIGYDPDNMKRTKLSTRSGEKDKELLNSVQDFNNLYSIELNLESENSQWSGSDMIPFWDNGFAGISFAAGMFNPYYHGGADRIDFINFDYLLLNAQLAGILLIETAGDVINTIVYENDNFNVRLIHPNPAEDYIEVNQTSKGSEIRIFNVMGLEVLSESIHPMSLRHRMYVSHLPVGVYFVRIGEQVSMFVKQ